MFKQFRLFLFCIILCNFFISCSNSNLDIPSSNKITEVSGENNANPNNISNTYLESIYIKSLPNKTEYFVGESFLKEGLVVFAKYTDGTEKEIQDYQLEGFNSSTENDNLSLIISYSENKITKQTTLQLSITSVILENISIINMPSKTTYYVGDAFCTDSMVIQASYNNSYTKEINNYSISFDSSLPNIEVPVLISFSSGTITKTTTIYVTVISDDLVNLEITELPNKIFYVIGDSFDDSGLKVKAIFQSGKFNTDIDYEILGFSSDTATLDQNITVVYSNNGITKQANFKIDIYPGKNGGLIGNSNRNQGDLYSSSIGVNGTGMEKSSEIIIIPKGKEGIIINNDSNNDSSVFLPQRRIKLSPYSLGQYLVTKQFYNSVMNKTSTNSLEPVNSVSFFEAIVFCNKLSLLNGLNCVYSYYGETNPDNWFNNSELSPEVPNSDTALNYANWIKKLDIDISKNGYRLPTEAEWEFAARGGNPNGNYWYCKFAFSNYMDKYGWYSINSDHKLQIVGLKLPNVLNLYDMNGNALEWCIDYKHQGGPSAWTNTDTYDYLYKENNYIVNPLGYIRSTTYKGTFTVRGGSYDFDEKYCSSFYQNHKSAYSIAHTGIRLCRTIVE